jgi:hypothetical protein
VPAEYPKNGAWMRSRKSMPALRTCNTKLGRIGNHVCRRVWR